jgi:nitrate/TMAO reductase-like tetraheme cytochrome c subunit
MRTKTRQSLIITSGLGLVCLLLWYGIPNGEHSPIVNATISRHNPETSSISPTKQDEMAAFRGNECVWCHSKLSSPLKLTSHYAEWHISAHKLGGISCDRCHGGNPSERDARKAHLTIRPASDPTSRLHPTNLAQTCQECHQPYVNAFVESRHYQKLKEIGVGPSCTTCHGHMASEVIYTPEQTAAMCASCHNATASSLPKQPQIGEQAAATMQAIRRASMVTAWADRLLEEATKRQVATPADAEQLAATQRTLDEAKAGFHTFAPEPVRSRADAAYEQGTRLKDTLRQKLYPNQ